MNTTTNTTLRRSIMRRVYYAFALSIVTHPMMLQGMALSISVALFAELVHVASLFNNLMHTELGHLPTFVFNAFARGEVLTILAVGVMVFTALSAPWQLRRLPRLEPFRVLPH